MRNLPSQKEKENQCKPSTPIKRAKWVRRKKDIVEHEWCHFCKRN